MKKIFVWMLAMLLCLAIFAGCGAEPTVNDPEQAEAPAEDGLRAETDEPVESVGEIFDAGEVSALVPSGWKAFPVMDVFAEEEDATDPTAIQIGKGAESGFDLFTKPYLQVNYYGPDTDMMKPTKDMYDDTKDLEPIKLDNYTWNGFTGKSSDYPIAILWAEDGDDQFQVSIWLEMDGGNISIDDADVQAIIASIQPSA